MPVAESRRYPATVPCRYCGKHHANPLLKVPGDPSPPISINAKGRIACNDCTRSMQAQYRAAYGDHATKQSMQDWERQHAVY